MGASTYSILRTRIREGKGYAIFQQTWSHFCILSPGCLGKSGRHDDELYSEDNGKQFSSKISSLLLSYPFSQNTNSFPVKLSRFFLVPIFAELRRETFDQKQKNICLENNFHKFSMSWVAGRGWRKRVDSLAWNLREVWRAFKFFQFFQVFSVHMSY